MLLYFILPRLLLPYLRSWYSFCRPICPLFVWRLLGAPVRFQLAVAVSNSLGLCPLFLVSFSFAISITTFFGRLS